MIKKLKLSLESLGQLFDYVCCYHIIKRKYQEIIYFYFCCGALLFIAVVARNASRESCEVVCTEVVCLSLTLSHSAWGASQHVPRHGSGRYPLPLLQPLPISEGERQETSSFRPHSRAKGYWGLHHILVIPGFFSMSRVHQCAPSRSLDRNKAPEDHWLCLLIDSPRSVWSHSKAASLPWPKWSHSSWPNSCFIAFHIIFASCCLWYQNS